jgi:hypothetical protein
LAHNAVPGTSHQIARVGRRSSRSIIQSVAVNPSKVKMWGRAR